ncbi:hypothetical protein, partial [Lysinibacillus sp. 54212]|uniref:hypothetical protein n=1 Tax=Lysinibacillus sp. 54212 TaxID=3119829 RepID=UPI002FC76C47
GTEINFLHTKKTPFFVEKNGVFGFCLSLFHTVNKVLISCLEIGKLDHSAKEINGFLRIVLNRFSLSIEKCMTKNLKAPFPK